MTQRLQNVLAQRGIASRRHAATLISTGQVSVNGTTVYEPGMRVDPGSVTIHVAGRKLEKAPENLRTVLLYKPAGLISSAASTQGETVCDLLRPHFAERLVPIGRLDKESEGLILLSNDGELNNILTHPRYGHSKRYIARVAGRLTSEKLATLRSPLEIDGYTIRPVAVELIREGRDNVHRLGFTLLEGRNRQIRKMCSLAHLTVLQLTRISIGHLQVGKMQPGEWRELSRRDIEILKRDGMKNTPAQQKSRNTENQDLRG